MNAEEHKPIEYAMFLDLETGGLNEQIHGIAEISYLVCDTVSLNVVLRCTMKIKPYVIDGKTGRFCEYTEKSIETHGISVEELRRNGLPIKSVFSVFFEVVKAYDIKYFCGHNVEIFDLKFIKKAYQVCFQREFFYRQAVCTLKLARNRNLGVDSNALSVLVKHFKISVDETKFHSAEVDVTASFELYKILRLIKPKQ